MVDNGGLLAQRDSVFTSSETGPSSWLVGPAPLHYKTCLPSPQTDTCRIFPVNSNGQERDPTCVGCWHASGGTRALAACSHSGAVGQPPWELSESSSTQKPFHHGHMPTETSLSKILGDHCW